MVHPIRRGTGAELVPVVVLPAPLEGCDDAGRAGTGLPRPADSPGPGRGTPCRGSGPGAGRPGDRADNLAHAFRARLCRVRDVAPGLLVLELVREDTLAEPIAALWVTGEVN